LLNKNSLSLYFLLTYVADIILAENSTSDLRLFSANVNNGVHICHSVTEVICKKIIVLLEDVSLIAYNNKENVSNRKGKINNHFSSLFLIICIHLN
jgi:hypothetical protein